MTINPFQLATQGIGPGWTTFNMATQGFGFDIEIIIQPVATGGSPASVWWPTGDHVIIVRIRRKDKTWEAIQYVSPYIAKSIEKVLVMFKGITFVEKTKIIVRQLGINIHNIFVKIRK